MKYEIAYETRKKGNIGKFSSTKVLVEAAPNAGMISILQDARKQLDAMGLEVRSPIIEVRNMEQET